MANLNKNKGKSDKEYEARLKSRLKELEGSNGSVTEYREVRHALFSLRVTDGCLFQD